MRGSVLGLTFAVVCAPLFSVPALAWSEANCRELCRLTAGDPPGCIQAQRCEQYRGGSSASKEYIRARAKRYIERRF